MHLTTAEDFYDLIPLGSLIKAISKSNLLPLFPLLSSQAPSFTLILRPKGLKNASRLREEHQKRKEGKKIIFWNPY